MGMPRRAAPPRRSGRDRDWTRLRDEQLLDVRLCDLDLEIPGTPLEERIERLREEIVHRELHHFRPHFWLGEDWFSPDGIPGVAIPFFLAHPRLIRLERAQMLEVEGGTEKWCMRILRHEAGHAFDNAYRLHRRKRWRELFGKSSAPYPEYYQPRPYSRRFVVHFDLWYAQSHPSEDFAETFAVWLRPRSPWRSQYRGWPVMKKLQYVSDLAKELSRTRPPVRTRQVYEPIGASKKTLRQYYAEKRARYGMDAAPLYDSELRRLFRDGPEHPDAPLASVLLHRHRRELRRAVATGTGEYQYTIDQFLGEVIERCNELDLRAVGDERVLVADTLVMLTVQVMNHLHEGHHRLAM
jgi:hypothetical protein